MYQDAKTLVIEELAAIDAAQLRKRERVITSAQGSQVTTAQMPEGLLNLCSNNYLGLANDPEVIEAAHAALDTYGFGLASVRFICGTQTIHRDLEDALTEFLGTEDTTLYNSCFDANGGLFETLLGPEDAIISDSLNHASIIDGIRLCKARKLRYRNGDMDDLAQQLENASSARLRLIATDGVFSMDGYYAQLDTICALADEHGALVMVDDSHAVGFVGDAGRGTPEYFDVVDRVDIVTGTLGKALGGAAGGYVSGKAEIVDLLRQRSRPYLFSNSVPPALVAGALKALELIGRSSERRDRLKANARRFREGIAEIGLDILPGEHPIVPIMLGDAESAVGMAELLLSKGVYVVGFTYPVVPEGAARIRAQVSALHSEEDLTFAIAMLREAREELASASSGTTPSNRHR